MTEQTLLKVRAYGEAGPHVVVLHGGPGAPGSMAPVARELSDSFRVHEPFQRSSDDGLLTVQRHIDDLQRVIASLGAGLRPALVGHSWGAMLALAYAARFPDGVGRLVLVGCGTFDNKARAALQATVNERATSEFRHKLNTVTHDITDADVRLCVLARLLDPLYTYDPLSMEDETEEYDSTGHDQTWSDMLRLQTIGEYPRGFAAIRVPAVMVHGGWDPHPGRMTFETLSAHIPQLDYVELRNCGHYPWRERQARAPFFAVLRSWLSACTA